MSNAPTEQAKFVSGSTMKHVITMTATGSLGLVAVFFVDLANLFYISLLGQQELAAAIGYAGTLLFFTISISIGITIATGALVSRALGEGNREKARKVASAALVFMALAMILLVIVAFPFLETLLGWIGAEGRTRDIALGFMSVVLPSMPLMGIGMCTTGILRAVGDAKRAMYVTLGAAVASAMLDPLFIFVFDLGVLGAAYSTVLARTLMMAVGLYGAIKVHDLVARPSFKDTFQNFKPLMAIAGPAVMTNVATPVGNAYVTQAIADFGDLAVAGWAVIGRVIPVAFGVIFALSGAIGPILGQNFGARQFDRIRQTMKDALIFTLLYTLGVWVLLFLFQNQIIFFFQAEDATADLIAFFCTFVAGSFLFNGALFVANAAFNNLGYSTSSTFFNWGKATLGTIPFVWVGAHFYGAEGVIAGQGVGAVIFGIAAIVVCSRTIDHVGENADEIDHKPPLWRMALSAFSSGKSAGL